MPRFPGIIQMARQMTKAAEMKAKKAITRAPFSAKIAEQIKIRVCEPEITGCSSHTIQPGVVFFQ